jgi:TRAP-type C4-dicarboxylate transport system permease large subunit
VPVNIIIKSTVPFLVMELIVLFLVTYVPPLSMFLPSILR